MDIVAAAGELAAFDPKAADRVALEDCAAVSARVRAWLDGFDIEVGRSLEVKTGYGAKVLADATNVSLASGERVIERGRTLRVVPAIAAAVRAGDVSGAHVDAATRALRQVDEKHRSELGSIIDSLVDDARSLPAERIRTSLEGRSAPSAGRRQRARAEAVDPLALMGRTDLGDVPRRLRVDSLNAVKIDKRVCRTRSIGCSPSGSPTIVPTIRSRSRSTSPRSR